jgi:hypothetical protein
MAIGVRITSNNLSGQTANVSFQPMTGGTPIDLGIRTIPFNYYSELPYGEYTLSSTTYDYVYTLTVSQPYGQNQNYMQLGNVSGETTFSLGFLNFNDFTAEVIDLGVDATYWTINTWYPLSESGTLLDFRNDGYTERLALFLDVNGNVVEQFSATTFDSNSGLLDGRIAYFQDPDGGFLYWFNGQSVYQYTFDPNYETLNIQWDWDSTCQDGSFFFILNNSDNDTGYSYKVNYDGSTILINSWDNTVERRYYGTYYSSNYFYELSYLISDDTLSSLKIYDTSLNEKSDLSIASNTYDSWDLQWYGDKSFNIMMWNSTDGDIDYLIHNYNGVTDYVATTTHVRGVNYTQRTINFETKFYPDEVNSGGIFIILYNGTGNYYAGGGYEVSYLDIIYRLENQTNFITHTFQNSGSNNKTFDMNSWGNKTYYTVCSTGDTNSAVFSITENGVNITSTNVSYNDINGWNTNWFGDYFNYSYVTDGNTYANHKLFLNGELVDSLGFPTPSGYNIWTSYETFYMTNYEDGYYVNNQVTGYTETEVYQDVNTSSDYYTQEYYYENSNIILYNTQNSTARVLTKDSLSNVFSLPEDSGEREIVIGKDKFLYVFLTNSDNLRVNLYNFNGALLNSTIVEDDYWSDIYGVKDRYVVKNSIDGQYLLTMISDDEVKQITIDNQYGNWDTINDYIWWDD